MVSHIFPRHTHDELPTASGGEGCFIFDQAGKKYLDASGGAAVSCLGHSHPKIISALHKQLDVLAYAHTSFFTSEPAERLATKLINNAAGDLSQVYLVSGGSVEIGVMIAFLLYVQRFFDPIRALTMHYSTLQRAMASGHRIFELLDIEIDIKDIKDAKDINVEKGNIEFQNVNFEYNFNEPVLKNLNFSINENETVGLVGPTGSGKTSIASLIHRFYEIKNGNIKIDGQNIQEVTQSSLSNNISMVLQDPIIFSGTVEDNIKYKAQASREELESMFDVVECGQGDERGCHAEHA